MEDFKKLPKMQYFKTGGSVKAMCYGGKMKNGGEVEAEDIKQDKAIVKKAIAMHDKQEHPGEKTDLSKLKKGGRPKKAVGSIKKYSGEDGSYVTKAVDAVKSFGTDIKNNILGTPEQNRIAQEEMNKQATKGSKLAKLFGGKADAESAPVKKCVGGYMKKGKK